MAPEHYTVQKERVFRDIGLVMKPTVPLPFREKFMADMEKAIKTYKIAMQDESERIKDWKEKNT